VRSLFVLKKVMLTSSFEEVLDTFLLARSRGPPSRKLHHMTGASLFANYDKNCMLEIAIGDFNIYYFRWHHEIYDTLR
jgi:hypothetical protein